MKIIHHLEEWQEIRQKLPTHHSLGFVPTMGNLHQGHASLFKKSIDENNCTIASIFVNPTQFNQRSDFDNYPRTLKTDLELLKKIGVNYCLLPDEQSLFADSHHFQISEKNFSLILEGKHRPGHFNGVLTVVMKLLNLTKPHCAYFGEKDYQQFILIRRMVDAFFMNIDVKICPTIREASGLACSSRNNHLTKNQRRLADQFATTFLQPMLLENLHQKLMGLGIDVEYIEEKYERRFIAIKIGDIRLIDNYVL